MLAAGLAARGTAVTVAGPSAADTRFSFSALPCVSFSPVEIAGRPRARRSRAAILRAATGRRSFGAARVRWIAARASGSRRPAADVAARARAARPGRSRRWPRAHASARAQRPGLVVTVHNAPPAGGAAGLVYRLLEQVVARGADLVLCVSPDLERRMRAAGARRVERAVIAAPDRFPQVAADAHASPRRAFRPRRRSSLRRARPCRSGVRSRPGGAGGSRCRAGGGRSCSRPGGSRRRRGSACSSRRPPPGGTWTRCRSW